MLWLDKVRLDEKSSVTWAYNRSAAQTVYEAVAANEGGEVEDLSSTNPLVMLIRAAMRTMGDSFERGWVFGGITSYDDPLRQPWFAGFEGCLSALTAEAPATPPLLS